MNKGAKMNYMLCIKKYFILQKMPEEALEPAPKAKMFINKNHFHIIYKFLE